MVFAQKICVPIMVYKIPIAEAVNGDNLIYPKVVKASVISKDCWRRTSQPTLRNLFLIKKNYIYIYEYFKFIHN